MPKIHFQFQSLKTKWPKAIPLAYLSFRLVKANLSEIQFSSNIWHMFRILTYSTNAFMEQIKERAWRLTKILIASYIPHQVCTPQVFLDVKNIFTLDFILRYFCFVGWEIFISVAETALMVSISVFNLSHL